MKCSQCGQTVTGRFCSNCGTPAPATSSRCPSCGAEVPAGARFCNQCGAPTGSAARTSGRAPGAPAAGAEGGGAGLGWWIAGGMMVVLIVILALPILRPDEPRGPAGGGAPAAAGGAGGPVDLSSMTPREAADRLFNRVMTGFSTADTATAVQFLPMAIQAYEIARPLDLDGLFHLAILQRENGAYEASLTVAREALADYPDHLLNLNAAARAADGAGDEAGAREYYARFLEVYDAESVKGLLEYQAHSNLFPEMRQEAEAYVGS